MKKYKNLVFTGADNRKSPYDLILSETDVDLDKPLVIFIHGYKGFKDWGAWDLVGEKFAENGYDFLKFNFSHNGGTVGQPVDFPDIEAFSENNFSKELTDMEAITKLALSGIDTGEETKSWEKVALIGHSRGGGIAILHAANNPDVSHLSTWASVTDFRKSFDFNLENWKEAGVTTVRNSRTGQDLPHKYSFYTDFKANEERLNIEKAVKKIKVPWVAVHGTVDESVPFRSLEQLKAWNPHVEIFPIADAGHTFGAVHPWTKPNLPVLLEMVCMDTIKFFDAITESDLARDV